MHVAIVGTGPTGVYAFQNLIRSPAPLTIALFEKAETLGIGMPYREETASKAMLANIASIEIPPLTETYLDWLRAQAPEKLRGYDVDPEALDERDFTPRLLLGEYFRDQLEALILEAEAAGHTVLRHPLTEVTDLRVVGETLELATAPPVPHNRFDKVILATGHDFEADPDLTDHYFPNPWSGLVAVEVPATEVGIMGTSLSAIDAAMAVANRHGRFRRSSDGLRYDTSAKGSLMLTLMSWTGILPEADFYCPIPHLPLKAMTEAALTDAMQAKAPFAAVYALFRAEIAEADPAWAAEMGLSTLDPEAFHDAYFRDRETHDPFDWARRNLEEVEANKATETTVEWRYAILRMHEQVETVVEAFSEAELKRFDKTLKKVFIDNYAAVPSDSIRRLLALHEAGVLRVLALGEDYEMKHEADHTRIEAQGKTHIFNIFIDARGQKPMAAADLPFPSLRNALIAAGQEVPEIAEDYAIKGAEGYAGRVYLAALPYLLRDQPFVQGITACAEIGETIAKAEARKGGRRRRAA